MDYYTPTEILEGADQAIAFVQSTESSSWVKNSFHNEEGSCALGQIHNRYKEVNQIQTGIIENPRYGQPGEARYINAGCNLITDEPDTMRDIPAAQELAIIFHVYATCLARDEYGYPEEIDWDAVSEPDWTRVATVNDAHRSFDGSNQRSAQENILHRLNEVRNYFRKDTYKPFVPHKYLDRTIEFRTRQQLAASKCLARGLVESVKEESGMVLDAPVAQYEPVKTEDDGFLASLLENASYRELVSVQPISAKDFEF
jgi:hypothetical protein